jgi:hypothetical protein
VASSFVVRKRDGLPYFVATVSNGKTSFRAVSSDAKELLDAFKDEYSDSEITKRELEVSLDRGMTVDGPMPESAVANALKRETKPSEKADRTVSREQALSVARLLGCRGAHQHDNGSWMPCKTHEEFEALKKGKNEYYEVSSKSRMNGFTEIEHRAQLALTKSGEYYESRQMAEEASRKRGCKGVRTINIGGMKYYAPCVATERFEKLRERPVGGIETLPDGGLVSAKTETKGFVPMVSRSTDPDTFPNPDSARVRARNLGCIGIRRYVARDGKTVWMPCSNGSDYNRVMKLRNDGSPKRNPRGRKSLVDSSFLQQKVARKPRRKAPQIDSETVNRLAMMVRRHNADVSKEIHRTNLRDVKIVYLRGLASGGETSAKKRLSDFLKAMKSDEPLKRGSRRDFDLVPDTHPSKDSQFAKKNDDFDDGVMGVKHSGGCCPSVVKRYHRL